MQILLCMVFNLRGHYISQKAINNNTYQQWNVWNSKFLLLIYRHFRYELQDFLVLVSDGAVVMEFNVHLLHVFPIKKQKKNIRDQSESSLSLKLRSKTNLNTIWVIFLTDSSSLLRTLHNDKWVSVCGMESSLNEPFRLNNVLVIWHSDADIRRGWTS